MRRFTIGFINHNEEVYSKYLKPCLDTLKGNFDIITTSDKSPPAKNYNDIIARSPNDWIILTHQDVTFSDDLLYSISITIDSIKPSDLGVLGMVGKDSESIYRWSNRDLIYQVDTLDCCFIVINKSHNLLFDDINFNDFHLYVEDYCARIDKLQNRKSYTILADGMNHHSYTCKERGYCWGRYTEYKAKFIKLYGNKKTT